ncbi:DUF2529 domain-containing protein [Mesobacillus persicus]
MFTTQVTGLFNRLLEKEEFAIEDSARLLAQAAAGEGSIYIYGSAEMNAIPYEATEGAEPLNGAVRLQSAEQVSKLTPADRVLIFARQSTDTEAVAIAEELIKKDLSFVAVSTIIDDGGLDALADVHIDLRIKKGMLPDENGERFGQPTSMAALFIYYGIKFTIDEMMAEYEE